VRPEPITLDEVAREAGEDAHPAAEEKGIELHLEIDGPHQPVRADRRLLVQVVGNLVSNAVKYTPPEGRVAVRSFAENGHVVIEVSAEGVGSTFRLELPASQ
jgi:two-component system, OmpR family, phosphate regulon sensor histidine kinase PhoR